MPVESSYDHSRHIRPARLWFGAVGAATAWALQGFTCFLIATQACANGIGYLHGIPAFGVRVLIGGVTGLYLAIALASTWVSYGNWRTLADHRQLMQAEGLGRQEYMALVGVFVGITSSVGLIWAGIPPFFLDVCNTIR
jgi:hypothetical protein